MTRQSNSRRHLIIATMALAFTPASSVFAADAKLAQPTDAKLISAAKAEGKVTFYGTSSVPALKSDADSF